METEGKIQTGLSDTCILLGGQPRSGTTLLSSILRSSKDHFQAFELHIRKPSFVIGLNGRYTRNIFIELGLSEEEYNHIVQDTDTSSMNLGAWIGPKEDVSAEQLTGKETNHFPEELQARATLVTKLMQCVVGLHGKRTWGFKILGDIIYANHYAPAFNNAYFILLVRDPRDNALSIMKLNSQRSVKGQQNFYNDYVEAAQGWVKTIVQAKNIIASHGLRFIEIRYEDLVTDTENVLNRLSGWIDIDLSNGLNFYKQDFIERQTERFKHHDNLKNPVNADSLDKWRCNMSAEEIAIFREHAGILMDKFDYND